MREMISCPPLPEESEWSWDIDLCLVIDQSGTMLLIPVSIEGHAHTQPKTVLLLFVA